MANKKKQAAPGPSQDGIRVMIVSLFIILLAFFIVLNSMAVIDEKKRLSALGSLIGSFGILPGGLSPSREGTTRVISPGSVPMLKQAQEIVELDEGGGAGVDAVTMRTVPEGRQIRIQDKVLFDKRGYKITPSGYTFLKKLCRIIEEGTYPVEVSGHTDSRPPQEKKVRSNQELSALRALEVLRYFVAVGGIDPMRLTAYGCGAQRPIASNETRQTRARNRRVDILLAGNMTEDLEDIYNRDESAFVLFKRFVFRVFE